MRYTKPTGMRTGSTDTCLRCQKTQKQQVTGAFLIQKCCQTGQMGERKKTARLLWLAKLLYSGLVLREVWLAQTAKMLQMAKLLLMKEAARPVHRWKLRSVPASRITIT